MAVCSAKMLPKDKCEYVCVFVCVWLFRWREIEDADSDTAERKGGKKYKVRDR